MKRIGMVLLAVALLVGCAGGEAGKGEEKKEATAVTSDSLYVEKIENLPEDFFLGADVSSLLAEEQSGVVYKNFDGQTEDMLKVLADSGLNCVRVRVWVDPFDKDGRGYGGGNCTAETAGEIGARAAKYGLKLLVDFHYSDFWADPAKQQAPKAWANLDEYGKADKVRAYTAESLQLIRDAGADIAMVQIGNETTKGICGETSVPKMCAVYRAGCEAVRAFDPNVLIAVHFTNPEAANFGKLAYMLSSNQVDYDVFATSYYPYWHGTLENLKAQLSAVATQYKKKVMVAETQWAYTAADGDESPNSIGEELKYDKPYPFTVQGQSREFRDVAAVVASIEGGIGVFYWEIGWIPVPGADWAARSAKWEQFGSGWASSYAGEYDPGDAGKYYGGSACDNQALFDFEGNPLESLKTFGLLSTGSDAPVQADALDSAVVTVRVGEDLTLPKTVPAIFTDGSRSETEVTWDQAEVAAVDTQAVGQYVIHSTGGDKSALCYVNVVEANYLENYSFEDKDLSMWQITALKAEPQADFQVKALDAYSGEVSLHFWNGTAVEFKCEQTVTDLPDGAWRISVRGQGGDVGDDALIQLYAVADGETYTATMTFDGWVNWQEAVIEHVPCASHTLTVGVYVRCQGGGWGTFDDFLLNPEK